MHAKVFEQNSINFHHIQVYNYYSIVCARSIQIALNISGYQIQSAKIA